MATQGRVGGDAHLSYSALAPSDGSESLNLKVQIDSVMVGPSGQAGPRSVLIAGPLSVIGPVVFSDDGRAAAFAAGDLTNPGLQLSVADLKTGAISSLGRVEPQEQLVISPDGRAVAASAPLAKDIRIIGLDGRSTHYKLGEATSGSPVSLSNGGAVAVVEQGKQLAVIDARRNETSVIGDASLPVLAGAVSSDGRCVYALASVATGHVQVIVLDREASRLSRVCDLPTMPPPARSGYVSWGRRSPDGGRIALEVRRIDDPGPEGAAIVIDPGSSSCRVVSRAVIPALGFAVSNQGWLLARAVTEGRSRYALFAPDSTGETTTELPAIADAASIGTLTG